MRRHWKKLALLLAVAAIAVCVLSAILSGESEPTYQGRRLSNWLMNPTGDRDLYAEALFQMRTNALPYLVKWACNPVPQWRASLEGFCDKHQKLLPRRLVHWSRKDSLRQSRAFGALGLLRTNAYPVLSELNLMANSSGDSERAWTASRCLAAILYGDPLPDKLSLRVLEEDSFQDANPAVREAARGAHRIVAPATVR